VKKFFPWYHTATGVLNLKCKTFLVVYSVYLSRSELLFTVAMAIIIGIIAVTIITEMCRKCVH